MTENKKRSSYILYIDINAQSYYYVGIKNTERGKEGGEMHQFDDDVLECFLDNQLQLFPEKVAETLEEAENFLEERT